MPLVDFNIEGDNDIPEVERFSRKTPSGPRRVDEGEVVAAAQEFAQAALGDELTVEQEDAFIEVYRRLETQAIDMNKEVARGEDG